MDKLFEADFQAHKQKQETPQKPAEANQTVKDENLPESIPPASPALTQHQLEAAQVVSVPLVAHAVPEVADPSSVVSCVSPETAPITSQIQEIVDTSASAPVVPENAVSEMAPVGEDIAKSDPTSPQQGNVDDTDVIMSTLTQSEDVDMADTRV